MSTEWSPLVEATRTVHPGPPAGGSSARYGSSVASLRLYQDGAAALAVGAPYASVSAISQGKVHLVWVRHDGSLAWPGVSVTSPQIPLSNGDLFGTAVAAFPRAEIAQSNAQQEPGVVLAVGAPGSNTVYLVTLSAAAEYVSHTAITPGTSFSPAPEIVQSARFGTAVASLSDLDGNGLHELVVCAADTFGVRAHASLSDGAAVCVTDCSSMLFVFSVQVARVQKGRFTFFFLPKTTVYEVSLAYSEKSPSLSPPDTQSAHDYQSVRSRAQTHHRWLMSHVYAYCGLAGWRRWLSDYSPAFCAVSSCTSRHEWSVPSTPRDGLFDSLHIVCSPEDMLSINAQTVLRKLSGFAYFEKDLVCFQGMACQILQLGAARARLFLVPFGSSSSRGAAWCLVTLRLTRRAEACRWLALYSS
eukprot:6208291-Pleurochrysis_carterae.AAC.3